MNVRQQINRKVNLRFTSNDGETETYPSRIKSSGVEHLTVLAPDIEDLSAWGDQEITIEEEPIGGITAVYETTVLSHETIEEEGQSSVLILNRPQDFEERRSTRIDVNFPITIKSEIKSGTVGATEEKTEKALATNLSPYGLLVILGLRQDQDLQRGQVVNLSFELSSESPLIFTLNAQVSRKYKLELGELSTKYAIAFQFVDISPDVENELRRYIFTNQVELQEDDLESPSISPQEQVRLLKDEINRLQEQLQVVNGQLKQAEEARLRSDTIIIQLTKKLNESGTVLSRGSWWRVWDQFGRR